MIEESFDTFISREGTSSVKWDLRQEVFGKRDVLPLWIADMDVRCPQPIIEAFKKRVDHGIFGYTGKTASFYDAIIGWEKRRHGWPVKREWISCCPGIVSGINTAIQAFSQPGDKVIIQPPVYHPFYDAVIGNGRQLVFNPLKKESGRFTIDFEDLEKKIDDRTKILILCSPHNPVGRVWTADELEKLAKICIRKDVIVLSDEIHQDIVYAPHRHIPIASLTTDAQGSPLPIGERTITFIAPSKTFNIAGLASSAVIIPNKRLFVEFEHRLNANGLGMGNVFGILGLEVAYNEGEEWLSRLLPYLEENIDFTLKALEESIPQIKSQKPDGTFLLWFDCETLGKDDLCLRNWFIEKASLGLDSGVVFGPGGEQHMRFNIGCPRRTLVEALDRLKTALAEEKPASGFHFTH
ncbi:MAG: PatB family C-S lyase [Thermotogota bacterium]|nr:PatB family C-S lyase [Thermotogota bacterium]